MFGSLITAFSDKADVLKTRAAIYIVVGIIIIVLISLLLDGIRRYIRGLDIAALGALLLFIGYQASQFPAVKVISGLLYLIGGTLFITGLCVFAFLKLLMPSMRRRMARRGEPESNHPAAQKETGRNR